VRPPVELLRPAADGAEARVHERDEAAERRAFTLAELRKLLTKADDEWQGMILVGYCCLTQLVKGWYVRRFGYS
jgi:hypothetical protein